MCMIDMIPKMQYDLNTSICFVVPRICLIFLSALVLFSNRTKTRWEVKLGSGWKLYGLTIGREELRGLHQFFKHFCYWIENVLFVNLYIKIDTIFTRICISIHFDEIWESYILFLIKWLYFNGRHYMQSHSTDFTK